MANADVQLVCFDLGRVLIRLCDNWRQACELARVPVPAGEMDEAGRAALHEAVCRHEVDEIDTAGFAQAAASLLGVRPEHVIAFSRVYLREPYPGVVELLDELRKRDVTTAVLSNTNADHWAMFTDPAGPHAEVHRRITYPMASHILKVRKPDAKCFECVEQRTGVAAGHIVFFDDAEVNVEGARRRGWRAERIDPAGDTAKQMREHLVAYGVLGR